MNELSIPKGHSKTHPADFIGSSFFYSRLERNVFFIVLVTMLYQFVLCLFNTILFAINPTIVMLVEFVIYLSVFMCVKHKVPKYIGLVALFAAVNFSLFFLCRGFVDPKSVRDILIIIFLFWFGFLHGTTALVDKILTTILVIAILFGCFEWLAIDWYVKLFHTFSYFVNQSGIGAAGGAIFEGQDLTLNGFRPDGIGRTILPWVFGSHRISSIFLEPVSLGNFAVIVLIWAICRDSLRDRLTQFYLLAAAFLIALADSRFGLAMSAILLLVRYLWPTRGYGLMAFLPWAVMCTLYIYGNFFFEGGYSDSFIGRLTHTGQVLGTLTAVDLLGLQSPFHFYGDMGYAYILTRFGVVFSLLLWLVFWRMPLGSLQAVRFRALISMYIAMILSISGTSLFALKSAGILWFIMGCLAAETHKAPQPLMTRHAGSVRQ